MADSSQDADGRFVANLMTIHASKGMEFDAVFLVGVEVRVELCGVIKDESNFLLLLLVRMVPYRLRRCVIAV